MISQRLTVWNRQWTISRPSTFPGGEGLFDRVAYEPRSRVLVCPRCQRHWAEMRLSSCGLDIEAFPAWCEGCAGRDAARPVPGSILLEEGYGIIDTGLLDALPQELLIREFRLHIAALDKETQT